MAKSWTFQGRLLAQRRFYTGMALAMLAAVFVGFARSFFLRPLFPEWPSPSETIFYAHGIVSTAWILLLVLQVSLVAMERTELHRRIGPFGAILAVTMVILGVFGSLLASARATGFVGVPIPPLQFLVIPIFDITLFAILVGSGLAYRGNPQYHKRLMLLATVNLLPAAIARWPVVSSLGPVGFFGLADFFIIALAIWDLRTRGTLHPVTLRGGLLIIVSQPLRLMVSETEGWLGFARWATDLIS